MEIVLSVYTLYTRRGIGYAVRTADHMGAGWNRIYLRRWPGYRLIVQFFCKQDRIDVIIMQRNSEGVRKQTPSASQVQRHFDSIDSRIDIFPNYV